MFKKGKNNKLRLSSKVTIKQSCIEWYCSHLSWLYGTPVKDNPAYDVGQKEIEIQKLHNIQFWTNSLLTNKSPVGTVINWGAEDDEFEKRSFVRVEFIKKIAGKKYKVSCIFSESELKRV